ncbi:MAG: TIGR02117 family protein [Alphaproteobacteria bacterium]|nr:TIGR02117 family protein [Alphaproteobacteria bacterium]MBV9371522.1 TIGR02117 family protein [Alphaproteobacteria bacterium]MBV9902736.1 TIGR02117 family protein [Alphaproteobacteria bacterium]
MKPGWKRALRIAGWVAGGLAAVPFLYLLAVLILGLIPANAGWREAKQGVTIFVRTNGVHTWIMVPKVTAEMDWRPLVPGADLKDPRWGNANYVAFGYGNRTVYLETPTWADLKTKDALSAAFGTGTSLIHADHDDDPQPSKDQRPLILSHAEYGRLVAYIRASFRYGPDGRPILIPGRGYGGSDAFYEAVGPYSALLTCNEWTGRGLRRAGVRTGVWTPLSQSIMWRLD